MLPHDSLTTSHLFPSAFFLLPNFSSLLVVPSSLSDLLGTHMAEATGSSDGPASTAHKFNPPSDPATPAQELTKWLDELSNIDGAPHVFRQPISFANGARRRSKQAPAVLDTKARATVSAFLTAHRPGKKTWLGLLSYPSRTWVGLSLEERDSIPWQSQAVAVIPNPGPQRGKHLVVFDPSPAPACEQSEANVLLAGIAKSLFDSIRTRKCKGVRLWYWTTTEHSEKNTCLQMSFKMLHRWAQLGDMAWQGLEDPRMKDCVEIKRI